MKGDKEKYDIYTGTGLKIEDTKQKDEADSEHPLYRQWMGYSYLTRSLMGGEKAMKAAGQDFLPTFELESINRYNSRLEMSTLKNAFRKTVTFLSGQVFQGAIKFDDEYPDELEGLMDDVDLLGSTINVFSKRVFETGIANGVSHILVEAPNETPGQTRQDDLDRGVRPYFKEVRAENLIGWQEDGVGNLVQARIKELATEPEGKFGQAFIPQIRVLVPGGWEIYRKDNKDWILHEDGETSLDYIPLATFLPGEPLSLLTAESPLQDLADLNLHHWRSFSDQINILHVARVPILFARDVDLEAMAVGASKAVESDGENADMKYVEVTGASIAAGANDLKESEAAMSIYGLQQMLPRTGNITATEKALSAADSNSNLAAWVNGYEDTLQRALEIWGEYQGVEVPEDSVQMPLDFESSIADPAMVQAVLKAVDSRVISKQAAFEYINESGALKDGYTWDMVQDELEQEARAQGTDLDGLFGTAGRAAQIATTPIAPAGQEGE